MDLNKQEYKYIPNYENNNFLISTITGTNIYEHTNNIKFMNYGNTLSTKVYYTLDKKLHVSYKTLQEYGYNTNGKFYYITSGLCDKEITEIEGLEVMYASVWKQYTIDDLDKDYNALIGIVGRNHHIYLIGYYNSYGYELYYPTLTDITYLLPDNELVFKMLVGVNHLEILTLSGKYYLIPFTFNRVYPIYGHVAKFWSTGGQSSMLVTNEGIAKYIDIDNFNSHSINLNNVKSSGHFENSTLRELYCILTHDGELYVLKRNNVLYKFDQTFDEDSVISNITGWSNIIYEPSKQKAYKIQANIDSETNEYYFTIIDISNLNLFYEFQTNTMPPYVNIPIDYYTYEYQSTRTNVTYKHRFALHQNISNDGLRNVVNYVTEFAKRT